MAIDERTVRDFASLFGGDASGATEHYATVTGDAAHVAIDGGEEAPIAGKTAEFGAGDRVTVMVKDRKAIVTGNVTAPATDDTAANAAQASADAITKTFTEFENGYKSTVANINGSISELQQTDESITARVSNAEGSIGTLTTRADSIEASVADKVSTSTFEQTSSSFTASIADAEKHATDYLTFSDGNLDVSSSATSYKTRINTDGVSIMNGDTTLASYGSTTTIGDTSEMYIQLDNDSLDFHHGSASGSISFETESYRTEMTIASEFIDIFSKSTKYSGSSGISILPTDVLLESDYNIQLFYSGNQGGEECGLTAGKNGISVLDASFVKYYSSSLSSQSLAASSRGTFSVTGFGLASGYSAVGIVAITTNHDYACKLTEFNLDSPTNPTVDVTLANTGSAVSDLSITVQIACIHAA